VRVGANVRAANGFGWSQDCDDPNGGPCGCGATHVTPDGKGRDHTDLDTHLVELDDALYQLEWGGHSEFSRLKTVVTALASVVRELAAGGSK
jgi:hypothetical protein